MGFASSLSPKIIPYHNSDLTSTARSKLRYGELNTLFNKDLALSHLGRYEEAITYYDKALAIDPNYVDVLNNKGVSLDKLGR